MENIMIDKIIAKEIVEIEVNKNYNIVGDCLIIIDEFTIEKDYGWIFFYTSKKYLETDDSQYALAGNGPIVVSKVDGSIRKLGTALHFEDTILEYEQSLISKNNE